MHSASSLNTTILRHATHRERQRGVALLLMLLVVLMIGGTFGLQALNLAASKGGVENPATTKILAQSKEALLAWTQNVDRYSNPVAGENWGHRAIRPGALPYPDVYGTVAATGVPLSTSPIVFDGLHDLGCIRSNWNGTSSLRTPNNLPFATTAASMRCLGKLPWRLLGLNLSQNNLTDSSGTVPWYAVSANLVNHLESGLIPCPMRLDASIANTSTTTLGCGSSSTGATDPPTLPFPWLSVRDPYGNLLSNRVAAVVIMPGPPTARQTGTLTQNNRATITATTGRPDQFLDTVRNAQCTPTGYCDNARFSAATLEFIQCVPSITTLNDSRFIQPYTCNDRLIYITIDELIQAASDRAAREAITCFNALIKTKGRAPYADDGILPRDATTGLTSGFIPTRYWDEITPLDWLPYCSDFSDQNWDSWQQLLHYDVSPANAAAAGWSNPGTLSIPGKTGNYKMTLWIDINGTKRWYGIQ